MSILKSNKNKENLGDNRTIEFKKQQCNNISLQQRLLLKEILEFILTKKLQPDQRELILKAYRRVQLFEKKEQWLNHCKLNQSFLNDFQIHTQFSQQSEEKISQEFFKLNQIVKHFLEDFLMVQQQQLTVENEFMESNLSVILEQVIADIQQLKILKTNVKQMIETLEYYKQETKKETNILISKLNDYIKMVLLHEADCQQMSIENQEIMLATFQQTFSQWYEKSKKRFSLKLDKIKELAEQAELEKKKLKLDLEELQEFEKRLSENKDLSDITQENKELRNQIFIFQQQIRKKGK